MLCQHLFMACQLSWTKQKNLEDFKNNSCKEFHGGVVHSLVKLEVERVQSIFVIICLGTLSIFPDATLIILFLLA